MGHIFDEEIFPDAWRINSTDCRIPENEKKGLIFLTASQSLDLWKRKISEEFFHLMKIPIEEKNILKKLTLNFSRNGEGSAFFQQELRRYDLIVFFWGAQSACIVQKNTFVENWTDFFYASDETSIIYIPNSRKKLFSYEDDFFVARFSCL